MEERLAATYQMARIFKFRLGKDIADLISNENPREAAYLKKRLETTLSPVVTGTSRVGISDFRFEKLIGAGGMGKVYLAKQNSTGRDVAIKKQSTKFGGRVLLQERNVMQALGPGITAELMYSFIDKNHLYLVMELMTGTLREWSLTPQMALYASYSLSRAIRFMHEKGFVHLDIKPENVLVSRDWEFKLGDFGWTESCAPGQRLKRTSNIVATVTYAAPETHLGSFSHKSDWWSYALTLAFLFSPDHEPIVPHLPMRATFQWLCTKINIDKMMGRIHNVEIRNFISTFLEIDPNRRPILKDVLFPGFFRSFAKPDFCFRTFVERESKYCLLRSEDYPIVSGKTNCTGRYPKGLLQKIDFVGFYYSQDDEITRKAKSIQDEHVLLKQKVTLLEATVAGQRDEISKLGHILDDKNSFVAAQSGELQQLKDMLETLTTSLELSGKQNEELRVEVQNKNAIIASCTTSATTSAKKKRVLKRPNLKIDDSGNPSTPLKSQSDVIPAAATNEEPKIHTCSKCNKQFLERKYLNRHIKSHDPSIACSTCGKRLAHNAALKQHQRSHDVGKFKCQKCGNTYKFNTSLQYHLSKTSRCNNSLPESSN